MASQQGPRLGRPLQDALASDCPEAVQLVTPGALMREVAKVHAMRSAGVYDFDAAQPMDLIHLLLGQSEPYSHSPCGIETTDG